jgi:hypothetical protein
VLGRDLVNTLLCAKVMHSTIEAVYSVWSMLNLCDEDSRGVSVQLLAVSS